MDPGPIIVIDDDVDDKDIFETALKELAIKNRRVWFTNCRDALDYLKTIHDQLFIIFCDVNIPGLAGIEFKRQIDQYPSLRKKSIPFIFYSTAVDQSTVNEAYTQMTVQGLFQKKGRYEEVKRDIKLIWSTGKNAVIPIRNNEKNRRNRFLKKAAMRPLMFSHRIQSPYRSLDIPDGLSYDL